MYETLQTSQVNPVCCSCRTGEVSAGRVPSSRRQVLTNLSAHEHVDEGVVRRAGLGEERGDDGDCGGDDARPAEGLHHGHDRVGSPAHQEAGNHQEEHGRHLLLVAQHLDDLKRLEVFDGAQLQDAGENNMTSSKLYWRKKIENIIFCSFYN